MAHILIIDDSELALEFTQMMVEADGHTTVTTDDPARFMELAEHGQPLPQLAIVDSVMPQVSGPDLIHQLRAHSNPALAEMPVLLVSALDNQTPPADGVLVLSKPFEPEDLQRALQLLLG